MLHGLTPGDATQACPVTRNPREPGIAAEQECTNCVELLVNAPASSSLADRSATDSAMRGVRTAIRDAHIDPLVDLLRAVAIVRVFLWHASGATGLTLIAAMPVMFFVMGSRLPSTVDRRLHADVLHRRGRRLLVPYWAYALAVLGAATVAGAIPGRVSVAASVGHLAGWVSPLVDPTVGGFAAGWLTNHLWYLRTYLWILLLLPVVAAAARRPVRSLTAAVGIVALVSGPWRAHVPVIGTGNGRVLLGDLVAYGSFAVIGMVWFRNGGSSGTTLGRSARRVALAVAIVGTGATVVWLRVQGLGPSGVNASYPAILLTGVTWLAGLAVVQPQLARFAARRRVAWASALVRKRALTIYLWHPAAIFVVRSLLGGYAWPERPGVLPMVVTVGLAAIATILVTMVVGVVENLGQRRVLSHVPHHVPHPSLSAVRQSSAPMLVRVGAAVALFALAVPAIPGSSVAGALEASAPGGSTASGAVDPVSAKAKGRVLRAPSYREALAADAFAAPVTTSATVAAAPGIATMASAGLGSRVTRIATTRKRTTRRASGTNTTVAASMASSAILSPAAAGAKASSAKAPSAVAPSAISPSAKAPSAIAPVAIDGGKIASGGKTVVPTASQLSKAVDAWFADTPGLDGAAVTILFGDTSWSTVERRRGSASLDPEAPFLTLSITKTFTAALVMREVEKGTLTLDGALPDLPGIAERPGITVRRLLTHESGLPDYLEVPDYNPRVFLDPRSGLALSLGAPALSKPGTAVHYANSNYLWLQLLLEKVTGKTYAQLVAGLTDQLHLDHTEVRPVDRTGWPGGGAGAIWSTTQDLSVWLRELMTPGAVVRAATLKTMRTLDDLNMGLGLWPACPCGTDASGQKVYTGIGHHIGEGGMYSLPASGGVVVVHSGPTGDVSILAASDLAARIAALAQG